MMTPATTIETPENEWKRDRTTPTTYLYKAALALETHGEDTWAMEKSLGT